MAEAVEFQGFNRQFVMPPYIKGETISASKPIPAFCNPVMAFTCWRLSEREVEEILRSREVWMAVRTGGAPIHPHWLGSLGYIKYACADMGGLWKTLETQD